ncbi:DUF2515 family protein [Litchfieldia alkalitelluris]|uniref:DUF2515 family protein n=1 Tax=Litchfieldia alkalitelluris TaxID=304268 RepID=UPI0009960292|nr:DUF2515 family protein [Litchfieldia alkalitelluris]
MKCVSSCLNKLKRQLHSNERNELRVATNEELQQIEKELSISIQKENNPILLIETEREIVQKIRRKTIEHNRNNITRTDAYLNFYKAHPEVHWTFLAHMVSRNAGWNMTDLKGDMVGELIPDSTKKNFFNFLERANALIFHDVYPQLLLYEYSKKHRKSYFHLLKIFNVSLFMKPIWEMFLKMKNSKLLTVALIINEQNYIEARVINHPSFIEILDSIQFKLQDLLGFSVVVFPYNRKTFYRKTQRLLAGITVRNFQSLPERILIGKKLYSILFQDKKIFNGVTDFAFSRYHTGSREDYWAHIFSSNHLQKGESIIYSPTLEEVWPDIEHQFVDKKDWFSSFAHLNQLQNIPVIKDSDITDDYIENLLKIYSIESIKNLII